MITLKLTLLAERMFEVENKKRYDFIINATALGQKNNIENNIKQNIH